MQKCFNRLCMCVCVEALTPHLDWYSHTHSHNLTHLYSPIHSHTLMLLHTHSLYDTLCDGHLCSGPLAEHVSISILHLQINSVFLVMVVVQVCKSQKSAARDTSNTKVAA